MKKTLSKILTMFLVVVMLFSVMATTALATGETVGGSGSGSSSESGSLSTGWCDLSYDKNGVTVVLYPDAEAVLGINKEQLKEVINLLVDAAKTIVVDDLKNQILGNTGTPSEPGVDVEEGTNVNNIWNKAFGAYIKSKYGSDTTADYVKFLKDIMADSTNAEIDAFIDYACKLLKSAVNIGAVSIDDLPEASALSNKVCELFENELNDKINDEITSYVESYIAWLEDPIGNSIDAEVENLISKEIKVYITGKVNAYITNGFKVVSGADEVDIIIAEYMDNEIHDTVDAWLKNYADGNKSANSSSVNEMIESKLEAWITAIADNYGTSGTVSNPIYNAVKSEIEPLVNQKVDEYIQAYLNAGTLDADIKAEIENQLETTCPSIVYELYWTKKDEGAVFTAGSIWETIHNEIRTEFVAALLSGGAYTQPQAEQYFDTALSAQIREDMGTGNEATAVDFIKNELVNLSPAEWKNIWNNELSESDRDTIISSVKDSNAFITKAREFIKEHWAADTAAAAARREDALNHFVYSYAGYETELAAIIADAESDVTYKSLIETEVNAYLSNVTDTLRSVIASLDAGKLQELKDAVRAEVQVKVSDPEIRNEAFENFFGAGMTENVVNSRINDEFIPRLLVDYNKAVEELKATPPDQKVDISTLLSYVQKVEIGGIAVYQGGTIKADAIKSLIATLPTPAEIANMTNAQMQLSYDILIVTDFGDTTFTATARLGGGYDAVRKAAAFADKVLAECVDFKYENGKVTLNIKVPEKFSELALRAIKSDKVPEKLKNKVFAAMSKNPDDAYALLKDVTLDELLSLLDYIDFEELLNNEYLSKFEKLDGLTADQIKAKAKQYEAYFNKLVEIAKKVYNNYIPASAKEKTLFDLYNGTGNFSYTGTHSVNIESVIEKVTPKYAALISSFMDIQTVTGTVDLTVDFETVNKVEYVLGGTTHRVGFLPAGADLAYFAGVTEYNGEAIIGWADADKNTYKTMPDADVTLYPVFAPVAFTPVVTPSEIDKVYDGVAETLTVSLGDFTAPAGTQISYQWYKDGVLIAGATSATLAVTEVTDSGVYYCKVTVTVQDRDPVAVDSNSVTVEISEKIVATVTPDSINAVYDGTPKTLTVSLGEYVPPIGAQISYQWYKDTVAISGATSSTLEVANVADSGEYYCVVTIEAPSDEPVTVTSNKVTVAISLNILAAITPNGVDKTYDGAASTLTAGFTNYTPPMGVEVSYQWYKDTVEILGATSASIDVVNVADSGEYYCTLTISRPGEVPEVVTAPAVTVSIAKKAIDFTLYHWNASQFTYDGTEKSVYLVDSEGRKLEVGITYVSNTEYQFKATAAGSYIATVIVSDGNYVASGAIVPNNWKIDKATYDMSGITFQNATVPYDGNAHSIYITGQLPTGVNVQYSANSYTEPGTYEITATFTGDADNYNPIPSMSATLVIGITVDSSVIVPAGVNKVYDGVAATLTASVGDVLIPPTAIVSYQWFKGTDAIVGATSSTLDVINVADSGLYSCTVTIQTANGAPVIAPSNVVTVTITKCPLDFSMYHWSESQFTYDGTEKQMYLVDSEGNRLVDGVIYVNNSQYTCSATNAGTYVAYAVVDSDNFTDGGTLVSREWKIDKAVYDMSGVAFNNVIIAYDGNAHGIFVTGALPAGVTPVYSDNAFTAPGTYTVTVSFIGDSNHEEIAPMTATLRIFGYINNHEIKDNKGTLIVGVSSAEGILERYTMYAKDVTTQFNYVVNDELFGKGKVGYVLSAKDIFFADGAVEEPVNGNFTVRLLIPENLRAKADKLKVVHIADNGDVTDMKATREENYFLFETGHFSVYAIVEILDAPVPYQELDLTWLWILLAVLAVLIIIAIIILVVIRKRRNGEPDTPVDTTETPLPETTEEAPVVEETTEEEPVAEEPVVEEPAVEEPAEEAPAVEEPAVEEQPAAEEPAVEEPVVEEPVVEEPAVEEPAVEEPAVAEPAPAPVPTPVIVDGPVVGVRYRTSFMSRLIQAEDPIQDYYTEIKNALLSYKGVKAKTSWNFESFNKGRIQCAKLNVKGNALQVYLGLDPNEYNANKYHFTDVSDKPKLDKVPMLLKVKSDRGLKYALELIEEMMAKFEIAKVETAYVDYHMPYETTEALAARELVKVILPPGITLDENFNYVKVDVGELLDNVKANAADEADEAETTVEAPAVEATDVAEPAVEEPVAEEPAVEEPVVEVPVTDEPVAEESAVEEVHVGVTVAEADSIISDEEAAAKIEIVEKAESAKTSSNKLVEINVDTLCENFEDGEIVTLEALKAKRLVSKNAGRIKILARGTMTKKLTVYADKFSLQAVKMITLAGGHADQYK